MKIIDARSGEVMTPGKTVEYGDGESVTLEEVDDRILSARALLQTVHRDPYTNELVRQRQWVPLRVRFLHPAFMFQRIGFIPS